MTLITDSESQQSTYPSNYARLPQLQPVLGCSLMASYSCALQVLSPQNAPDIDPHMHQVLPDPFTCADVRTCSQSRQTEAQQIEGPDTGLKRR